MIVESIEAVCGREKSTIWLRSTGEATFLVPFLSPYEGGDYPSSKGVAKIAEGASPLTLDELTFCQIYGCNARGRQWVVSICG